jgi:hypothetical protein
MSLDDDQSKPKQKLETRQDFEAWYSELHWHATVRGIWHLVDPYAADAPNIYAVPPKKPPTAQALMDKLEAQRSLARANWRAAGH